MEQSQQNPDNNFVDASLMYDQKDLLPDEVIFDVISRLPVETIIRCKCVCKKWLNLLSESYFVNLHLSRSLHEGLLINQYSFSEDIRGTILEFWKWEEINHQYNLVNNPLIGSNLDTIDFIRKIVEIVGSVNGLICFWNFYYAYTYICNPMIGKGEYMLLPKHQFSALAKSEVRYGFGVSILSGKYKVVRIFSIVESQSPIKVEVYTLGTDQWRTLDDQVSSHLSGKENHGLFFNGNVYWILGDHQLYTFDLDNETFQLFPSPPLQSETRYIHQFLAVLRGCLARIYISSHEISIWAMKEHGVKTSWHQELVIKNRIFGPNPYRWDPLCLVDGSNGKTILVVHARDEGKLLAYCHETETVIYCRDTNTLKETKRFFFTCVTAMTYRPSFLTLHNFQ